MGQSAGDELREVLTNRRSVLESVSLEGKTKPELVDELPYSRSTIDRAMEQLDGVGCVLEEDRRFHVSPVGKTTLQLHREYVETSDGIRAAEPVLNALAPDDPVDHAMFRGAEVYVSDPQVPEAGLERSIEVVRNAASFRGYAPVVFEGYFDVQVELLQRDGFRSDLVIESGLYDQIQTHFADEYATLIEQDGLRVFVTDRMISYAPWLAASDATTYAGMTVYEDGAIQGVIVNDSDGAVEWIDELLSALTDSATRRV